MDELNISEIAGRLAVAAEALERAISAISQQHENLSARIERIVAAVEETEAESRQQLKDRIAELERVNAELEAETTRLASSRKTLPPLVTALLSKNSLDLQEKIDLSRLDQTLASLPVDQRIAVKAQMARAGLIE